MGNTDKDLQNNEYRRYKVYVYTNKVNGKKYVGQTCQSLEYRANNGRGYKRCLHFYRAIEKYGWDNFEPRILSDCLTKKEADVLEKMYINILRTRNNEYGYNITEGGHIIANHTRSVIQFDKNFNYIKRFNSIKEASLETGVKANSINMTCSSNYLSVHSAGGYRWCYECDYLDNTYIENVMRKTPYRYTSNEHGKTPVVQLTKDMTYIKSFPSITIASNETICSSSDITSVCRKLRKTSKGYIWMYEQDYFNYLNDFKKEE